MSSFTKIESDVIHSMFQWTCFGVIIRTSHTPTVEQFRLVRRVAAAGSHRLRWQPVGVFLGARGGGFKETRLTIILLRRQLPYALCLMLPQGDSIWPGTSAPGIYLPQTQPPYVSTS